MKNTPLDNGIRATGAVKEHHDRMQMQQQQQHLQLENGPSHSNDQRHNGGGNQNGNGNGEFIESPFAPTRVRGGTVNSVNSYLDPSILALSLSNSNSYAFSFCRHPVLLVAIGGRVWAPIGTGTAWHRLAVSGIGARPSGGSRGIR
jgi:hypothetical protein